MSDTQLQEKYGQNGEPIKATRAFKKPMAYFASKGVDGISWILINDETNKVIRFNTYNGKVGKKWQYKETDLTEKTYKGKIKDYTEVPVSECPAAN